MKAYSEDLLKKIVEAIRKGMIDCEPLYETVEFGFW
jgi:hypothetical protein